MQTGWSRLAVCTSTTAGWRRQTTYSSQESISSQTTSHSLELVSVSSCLALFYFAWLPLSYVMLFYLSPSCLIAYVVELLLLQFDLSLFIFCPSYLTCSLPVVFEWPIFTTLHVFMLEAGIRQWLSSVFLSTSRSQFLVPFIIFVKIHRYWKIATMWLIQCWIKSFSHYVFSGCQEN